MSRYLIDTNVVSELPRRSPNPKVIAWLAAQPMLTVSAITIEELVFGVERLRPDARRRLRRWLDALLALSPEIVPIDSQIAGLAGRLRATRQSLGRPVAQADMLIAATAIATGRSVATRNIDDFADLGVEVFNPFE